MNPIKEKLTREDLYKAVCAKNKEKVALCIAYGVDVNESDCYSNKYSLLMETNDTQIAALLLNNGARINDFCLFGATALYFAVRSRRMEMVQFLCNRGADVNIADNYGVTPLKLAQLSGNASLLQILLQHGAIDPDGESKAVGVSAAPSV